MSSSALRRPRRQTPRLAPEQRRNQLLDAALRIVGREGVSVVTIDAVAREAEVTRPIVYKHFDDAFHVLRELLDREEERALAQVLALLPENPDFDDPAGLAAGVTETLLRAVLAEPDRWRAIVLMPGDAPPPVPHRMERARRTARARLTPLFAAALEHNGLGGVVEPEMLAWGGVALFEASARDVLANPEEFTPERVATFVHALTTRFMAAPR